MPIRLNATIWNRPRLCAAVLLALGLSLLSGLGASFRTQLDRATTTVGESVNLSLIFEEAAPGAPPPLPSLPNIQVAGSSQSQNFVFNNGKTSSQVTYTYVLIPTQAGEITIPPLRATVGSQTLVSQPLKLTVQPPADGRSKDGAAAEAFRELHVPKTQIYLGEIIPLELRLYFQHIRDVGLPQLSAEGFVLSPMPQRPDQNQVHRDGRTYNVAIFRMSLSAAKTGSLTLGPATCSLTLLFDPRRNFFGETVFARSRPAVLSSDSKTLQVLPLPQQNQPDTFNGAIGNFSMNLTATPTDVAVGDPVTVRIRVEGRGTIESLTMPAQPAWREFKAYTPSSNMEMRDPLGIEGTKVFELVVSPQNAGVRELPPFSFSFFDPDQKAYRTLTHPAIPLNVRPSAATPQPTVFSAAPVTGEPPPETREIVHIKPSLGSLKTASAPLIAKPWFWAVQLTAPALWLGSLLIRRHRDRLEKNPRLRRQREVARAVDVGLQKMKRQAAEQKADEFFATMIHVLQEQIGERLNQPAPSITEAVIDEELSHCGLRPETLALLRELFQTCNQARYAPQAVRTNLDSFIPKLERVLSELKSLKHEKATVTV